MITSSNGLKLKESLQYDKYCQEINRFQQAGLCIRTTRRYVFNPLTPPPIVDEPSDDFQVSGSGDSPKRPT